MILCMHDGPQRPLLLYGLACIKSCKKNKKKINSIH